MGWNAADLFDPVPAEVSIAPGQVDPEGARIEATCDFGAGRTVRTRFLLRPNNTDITVTATQAFGGEARPFSVFWPVTFAGPHRRLWIDTGHGLIDALADHLPVSSTRWQAAQRGIAFEAEDGAYITIAAPDTPLFQPGGPWAKEPFVPPDSTAHGVFWSIHTHWDTNFPIRVGRQAPARFVLRYVGQGGLAAADTAMTQATVVPVIVRTPNASPRPVRYWGRPAV